MKVAGFEWDEGNWPKCGKHGVSQAEIEFVFKSAPAIFEHPGHSVTEQRLRAIGRSPEGRHIYVSFTLRERSDTILIRPVSARYMHRKEVERHERQQEEDT